VGKRRGEVKQEISLAILVLARLDDLNLMTFVDLVPVSEEACAPLGHKHDQRFEIRSRCIVEPWAASEVCCIQL